MYRTVIVDVICSNMRFINATPLAFSGLSWRYSISCLLKRNIGCRSNIGSWGSTKGIEGSVGQFGPFISNKFSMVNLQGLFNDTVVKTHKQT